MMIRWLEDAVDDLYSLRCYIARENSIAATEVVEKILHAVNVLSNHPEIGRSGRVSGTRELIIPGTPYIIPYRIKSGWVEILRVFHGAMQWPEEL